MKALEGLALVTAETYKAAVEKSLAGTPPPFQRRIAHIIYFPG
jgi:hypothetical protein